MPDYDPYKLWKEIEEKLPNEEIRSRIGLTPSDFDNARSIIAKLIYKADMDPSRGRAGTAIFLAAKEKLQRRDLIDEDWDLYLSTASGQRADEALDHLVSKMILEYDHPEEIQDGKEEEAQKERLRNGQDIFEDVPADWMVGQ